MVSLVSRSVAGIQSSFKNQIMDVRVSKQVQLAIAIPTNLSQVFGKPKEMLKLMSGVPHTL